MRANAPTVFMSKLATRVYKYFFSFDSTAMRETFRQEYLQHLLTCVYVPWGNFWVYISFPTVSLSRNREVPHYFHGPLGDSVPMLRPYSPLLPPHGSLLVTPLRHCVWMRPGKACCFVACLFCSPPVLFVFLRCFLCFCFFW